MSINDNKICTQQQQQNVSSAVYVRVGSYDLLGTIGKGNFSVCKLAQNRLTSQKFAIKCIEKKNLDAAHLTRLYREIEIMKSLDHPNIIKLFQVMESKSMLYLVCEYACNGEIFEYIFKNGAMNEKLACQKFCQILSAVEYCHLKNIVHRDLKSENLLLDSNMNIKLADFGFANYFDYNRTLSTFCGSPPYAAPEIFLGKKYYGPEIDVWSLGVILYVLVSASLPFDSDNLQTIKQKVISSKFRVPYYMSQDCEDLISNMLVVNSSKRYKMQQIKSHRWIKINNSSFYYQANNASNISTNTSLSETITSEPKNKDRIKSKSLKIVGNRTSKQTAHKPNLAISSLSLPLYTFDIEDNDSNQTANITQNKNLAQLDSLSSTSSKQKPTPMLADFDLKSTSHQSSNASSSQPVTMNIIQNIMNIRRYSEFISNSSYQSSVDEGVESDWSSSLSSDLISITSSNSVQSFYLNKSSQSSSAQTASTSSSSKKTATSSNRNKSLLPSTFLFSRGKHKFRGTKPVDAFKNKSKNSFDLKEIKHELNCLQMSISNIKHSNLNNINMNNLLKKSDENTQTEFSFNKSSNNYQIEENHSSLKKFKQFLFLNNSKKKISSYNQHTNNNNNKSKIFSKQKSSSLNSINNEECVKESLNTNEDSNSHYRVHKFKFSSLRKYSLNKLA